MNEDEMIARAQRIMADERNQVQLGPWAEALLAERQARLDAERELGERMDAAAVHYGGAIRAAEAERDALAAALRKAREQVVWLVEHVAEDWAPEAEEAVRADLAAIDAALALLPPASQEAVSDG